MLFIEWLHATMRIGDASHLPAARRFPLLLAILFAATSLLLDVTFARDAAGPRISRSAVDLHGAFYFQDSETVLAYDRDAGVLYRSTDAGEHWDQVKSIPEGEVGDLWQHPYDPNRAYVLSPGHRHWYTKDQGQTWHEFETDASPGPWKAPLKFHASDSDKIIFQGDSCAGFFDCEEIVCGRAHVHIRTVVEECD